MEDKSETDRLFQKLANARSERDAWRGKSDHHYKMALLLVDALEKQLSEAIAAQSNESRASGAN